MKLAIARRIRVKKGISLAGTVAALALLSATPAGAAIVTTNYAVSGTGTGTFTLDFNDATLVYSLTALDLTIGSASYDASTAGIQPDGFLLGGNLNGINTVFANTDDFYFFFNPTSASQDVSVTYALVGSGITFGTSTITQVAAPSVPEPATWAMMLLGFGAAGLAFRRRRPRQLATATA
jgi:hypothetical protein